MNSRLTILAAVLAIAGAATAFAVFSPSAKSKKDGYWAAPPGANQGSITFSVTCSTDPDGQIENPCPVRVTLTKTDGTTFDVEFTFAKGSTATAVAGYFKAKAESQGFTATQSGHTVTFSPISKIDCDEKDGLQIEHKIECGTGVTEVKIKVQTGDTKKGGSVKIGGVSGLTSIETTVLFADGDDAATIVEKIQMTLQAAGWTTTLVAPDTLRLNTMPGGMTIDKASVAPHIEGLNNTHWALLFE